MSVRGLAERLGIHKNTANKALWELLDKGFLRVAKQGSFNWKQNVATTYVLTQHKNGEETATKGFMRWKPDQQTS